MAGRLAFTPSRRAREYFDRLVDRLTAERGLDIQVTQREAFERLVEYAERGEKVAQEELRILRPPLAPPLTLKGR